MTLRIHFVCDVDGCGLIQPLVFDAVSETYGDALAYVRADGWSIELDELYHVYRCTCPQAHDSESIKQRHVAATFTHLASKRG